MRLIIVKRFIAVWLVLVMMVGACGTPEPASSTQRASTTDAPPTTTVSSAMAVTETSTTTTSDTLFPPDASALVLWITRVAFETDLELRVHGPNDVVAESAWALEPDDRGRYRLLEDIEVLPGEFLVEFTVRTESTDATAGQGGPANLTCASTFVAEPGVHLAITLVPNNLCFPPTYEQWREVSGEAVSPGQLHARLGPDHCGWEHLTFLTVDGLRDRAYVNDATGTFGPEWYTPGGAGLGGRDVTDGTGPATTAAPFEPLSFAILDAIPGDATDTGHRLHDRELWASPSGDYVYLRFEDRVEQWPLITPSPACA